MPNPKHTNHLIKESSPYLLQHAHNPVNWYPWNDEALNKAKRENKLILVSVGYAACHWCHVMERESFEDEKIAQLMNDHFVCIKVDREERPDIDQIYMTAVQIITGSGGWPLNCFALPDGRPVYGGTYFKPEQWIQILEGLSSSFKKEPEKFEKAATEITQGIKTSEQIVSVKEKVSFNYEDLLDIILKLRKNFDHKNGGNWGAPKFPMPVNYFPLMRYYFHTKDKDVYKHLQLTLSNIANGGIYDHLGGGFSRYSVDKEWLVPHFEKMLYDNAQLVSLYSEAYNLIPEKSFKRVVEETLEFIEREMQSPEGGFYSSYDADSEGEEGKFYVWDKYEIDSLLGEMSEVFCEYYNISMEGNWEGRNILHVKSSINELANKYELSEQKIEKILSLSKDKLFKHRAKRKKPALDDKILTSWNALMAKAYMDAYKVFKHEKYLVLAKKNIDFLLSQMLSSDLTLKRNIKNGKATINAFLDDYALLIEALINLYQITFEENYIELARDLTEYTMKHFYDEQTGMFFYTSSSELITRSKELSDNVIPSSNSVMANNLFILSHLFLNQDFFKRAKKMIDNMKEQIKRVPSFHGNWFNLMIQFVHKPFEICIVGEDAINVRSEFSNFFLPNTIFAGGSIGNLPLMENRYSENRSTIYVCQNSVCNNPVKSIDEALDLLSN